MKKIIEKILKFLARLIIKKYKPEIIAITGSVGKTSTKEAIFFLLNKKFKTRTNIKNYNNEIGLPLTIIGQASPGRNIYKWFKLLIKSLFLILIKDKNYPKILVLEYGIDRPGDMKYLTSIAKPDISVVTAVSHSHYEFFGSLENIKKEKQVLVEETNNNGLVILNYDNKYVREMENVAKTSILSYGKSNDADLKAVDIVFKNKVENNFSGGLSCKIDYNKSLMPLNIDQVLNEAALYSILAAYCVGTKYNINLVEISSLFKDFKLPAGRMNIIKGINNSIIIDDSYNASPESSDLALKTIENLETKGKKYVVFGDMLEIGSYSKKAHILLGQNVKKAKIDYLITKGDLALDINQGAIDSGYNENKALHLNSFIQISNFLKENLKDSDIVLVKGSQGARMEKVLEEIILDKKNKEKLLVRQDNTWQ